MARDGGGRYSDVLVPEKFVLVPEVCPVGSMTSAAGPTFLPALSEVYSLVFFSQGGGAKPLAVVESYTARGSGLPVESDTAGVSVLPVVGSEVPAVYVGKVALDSVGVKAGPSGLRFDPEETLQALLDKRSMMSCVDLGVTPDGGPIEGAPVLELLEHSVLEKSLDGGPMEGPGRWTYGGGNSSGTVRAFSSGNNPGRRTHSGLASFGTVRAFGSGGSLGRSTQAGSISSGTIRAFSSGRRSRRRTFGGDVSFGTIGTFGPGCCLGRG